MALDEDGDELADSKTCGYYSEKTNIWNIGMVRVKSTLFIATGPRNIKIIRGLANTLGSHRNTLSPRHTNVL